MPTTNPPPPEPAPATEAAIRAGMLVRVPLVGRVK